jgi:diguanylate cyclase (GGDEF)-like protein
MNILLVEDTRVLAAVMALRLESFGNEVSIAENGQVAVDKFVQSSFDLVLMDIEMPVMNGFEATNQIRAFESTKSWAWTPILFLTASDTAENLVTAIEAGGDDFISKSVPEVVLQAKMKAMARIAALRQRLAIANDRLADLASRDGLTGLCNRRSMDSRLDEAWADAICQGASFGLLMIDIDNFKKYNDHYGHQSGDECLRTIATAMANVIDTANADGLVENAFLARYGGEEFAIIMPAVPPSLLERIAALILEAVRGCAIEHVKNADLGIATVSIGGIYQRVADGRIADLFRAADKHLYKAKDNGRNRVELAHNSFPAAEG